MTSDRAFRFLSSENGKVTHKVVGAERQPDPPDDADGVARIDADLLALIRS